MSSAFAVAGEEPVSRGTITYLRTGVAVADLLLAVPADRAIGFGVGDAVTVIITDEDEIETTFRMTCWRAGVEGGFWGAALCGGAARLGRIIEPRYYEDAEGQKILSDALRECGETPSEATTLAAPLGTYVRRRGPAYQDVATLVACYRDATWRTLADGTIWAGEETWPDAPDAVTVVQRTPQFHRFLCEVAPQVRCGQVVRDQERTNLGGVERVVHQITRVLRTELWVTPVA